MKLFDDWRIRLLYWGTYLMTIAALWYHTYQIFLVNDPPFIAGASAAAIDGMLALTLYVLGKTYGKQKDVAITGTILFALLSAGAQLVSRNMDNPNAPWVQTIALYLLPVSGVFTLLVLAFIKYFDTNQDGVPDFMQRGKQKGGGSQQHFRPQASQRSTTPLPQPRGLVIPPPNDEMERWEEELMLGHSTNGRSSQHDQKRDFGTEVVGGPVSLVEQKRAVNPTSPRSANRPQS